MCICKDHFHIIPPNITLCSLNLPNKRWVISENLVIFCTVWKSRRMSLLWRQRRKVSAQTEVRVRAHPPLWSRAGVIFSPDVNTVCECFRITKTHHTAAKLPQPFDIRRHYRPRGPLPTVWDRARRSTPEEYAVIIGQPGERKNNANPQRWQERPWTVITAISSGSRRMSATTVDQVRETDALPSIL